MHPPKISIVIPIYNAEKYLHVCLNSAIEQTLKDIEIICVNDCSTDSSSDILREFSNGEKRLRILEHDTNKGEGAARNTGIDNARGDYIFHLDADDKIPLQALEKLYIEAVTHDSDLVKGRHDIVYEDGEIKHLDWSTPDKKVINTNIYVSSFLQNVPTSHCTYLYRRDFINHYKIRYRTDLCIGLDLVMLATTLIHARAVTLIPVIVYYYYQSEKSAIRSKLTLPAATDAIRTKQIIIDMFRNHELNEAAATFLQTWEYLISTQWCRMPEQLNKDESTHVFDKFRTLITANNIKPWTINTRHHYRYVLALVIAGHDDDALNFLSTKDALEGFSTKERLVNSLEFILQQAPNDAGVLIELAQIARKEGDLKLALHIFEKAIKNNNNIFTANIQAATLLKELGQYAEARSKVNSALEILTRELSDHEKFKQILTVQDNIICSEKAAEWNVVHADLIAARNELDESKIKLKMVQNDLNMAKKEINISKNDLYKAKNELNLIYSSASWKITKPLRKLMSIVKHST